MVQSHCHLVSVSYTHLDVYKRQPYEYANGFVPSNWNGRKYNGDISISSALSNSWNAAALQTFSAVSYTHLDVYKRQLQYDQVEFFHL